MPSRQEKAFNNRQCHARRGRGRRAGQAGRGGRGGNVTNFPNVRGNGGGAAQGTMRSNYDPTMIVRSKPLFGYRTRRNIQYYETNTVSSGINLNGAYVYSVNGCYDPNITGTGGQPMGFDQMMIYYNHYTCLKCKITLIATNNSTTNLVMVAIGVSGSATVTTDYSQLVESGDIVAHQLGFGGQIGGQAKMMRTVSASKFQGIDDIMDDPNMRGDAASNPTEQLYFHINAWSPYSSAQVAVNFQVILEYDVIFHEPRVIARSLRQTQPEVEQKEESPFEKVAPASTIPFAYFLQSLSKLTI